MIVMLLTSQNEADVLQLNLEHHLSWGVDHIVVCDNDSSDDTAEVTRAFGTQVTRLVFADFAKRQQVRTQALEDLKARYPGQIKWAGVSDTDEFFWAADVTMPDLLAAVPESRVAVTFHQKLFVPTELDRQHGPVYRRLLYRTGHYDSPLHRGYVFGKSFYRTSWLTRILTEHYNLDLPHEPYFPAEPYVVHHYMIRDEDQFVTKVQRLSAWRSRKNRWGFWYQQLRRFLGFRPQRPAVPAYKLHWWDLLQTQGEEALRRYYRTHYRVQAAQIPDLLGSGTLVRDDAFAVFTAAGDLGRSKSSLDEP